MYLCDSEDNINLVLLMSQEHFVFKTVQFYKKYIYKSFEGSYCRCTSNLKKFNGKKIDVTENFEKDGLDYARHWSRSWFFSNVHEGPKSYQKII